MDSNNSFNGQKREQSKPNPETSEDVISTEIFSSEEESDASEINEPGFCLKELLQGMYDYCAIPFYMLEIFAVNGILLLLFIMASDNDQSFFFSTGILGIIDIIIILRLFISPIKNLNKTPPQIYPNVSKTIQYSWGLWISGVIIAVSFAFCSFPFKSIIVALGIVMATIGTWIWYSFFMKMEDIIISPEIKKDQKVSCLAIILVFICVRNFILVILSCGNPESPFFLKLLSVFGYYQITAWLLILVYLLAFHNMIGFLLGSKAIDQTFYSEDIPAIKEKLYTPLSLKDSQAE